MIKELTDAYAMLECSQCGKLFRVDAAVGRDGKPISPKQLADDPFSGALMKAAMENQVCDECIAANQKKVREQEANDALKYRISQSAMLMEEAGVPRNMRGISKPPNRGMANFLWKNQDRNILLVGNTGVGKTTSACACLERMRIMKDIPVKYINLSSLVMKMNAVSRFGSKETPLAFMDNLDAFSIVCIDEAFEKTRQTDMTSEILYMLIDSATSGAYRFKLWLLGNLKRNAIQNMFGDYEPVMRRFEQFFLCCYLDQNGTVVNGNINELKGYRS